MAATANTRRIPVNYTNTELKSDAVAAEIIHPKRTIRALALTLLCENVILKVLISCHVSSENGFSV